MSSFVTEKWSPMFGGTEPNQKVTPENIEELPTGSVITCGDGSRIIHLHDSTWLWIHMVDGCTAHCYDNVDRMKSKLDENSVLCHHP